MKKIFFISVFSLFFSTIGGFSQSVEKMLAYDFDGALQEYKDSLSSITDSLKRAAYEDAVRKADNAITMTEFCHHPSVVARQKFSVRDFYLHYPLPDKAWHATQDSAKTVYSTNFADTLTLPRRDSLELFPMVCGKDRYFASKDLFGMGGYDLYVSRWDDKQGKWGEPQNLGFPYSSPYNDYLFINTEDGRYSIFASDRECGSDSVFVYVLEYDSTPVRSAESDPAKLLQLSRLEPVETTDSPAGERKEEDANTIQYKKKLGRLKTVREKINAQNQALEALRDSYSSADNKQKQVIADRILKQENELDSLNAEMKVAAEDLQSLELEFLRNGVTIDASALVESPVQKDTERKDKFTFPTRTPGNNVFIKYN